MRLSTGVKVKVNNPDTGSMNNAQLHKMVQLNNLFFIFLSTFEDK